MTAGEGTHDAVIVLDIGKTNVKLVLIDAQGQQLAERRKANTVLRSGPYPHHDTDAIWEWMLETIARFATIATVGAIVPVTHGATAALVDEHGLVLPVLDYEYEPPAQQRAQYLTQRAPYASTYSPALPAGLNLGRQLAWLAAVFPADFARTRHILMYPQYWAWRLSGVAAGEVTSLGCHTDLWQPARQQYSALVERMGWHTLMPPLFNAWDTLGPVLPALAQRTGLPAHCRIVCGIHDSNASLLRHLNVTGDAAGDAAAGPATAVLSTGTWVIAALPGGALDGLREEADMLANCSALGQPVPCIRFMGGREFAALAGAEPAACGVADLQQLIDQGTFALPAFADAGGPFSGRTGSVIGPPLPGDTERTALATLYCALMSDYCLTQLGAQGDVVVEGSFTNNPHFAPLLAALRPGATVSTTDDASGTTCGGWMLAHWGEPPTATARPATPLPLRGWPAYRDRWLDLLR
ncbi:sugar (pentulose or hexulose) kinase [Pseudoduganella flava]|uniref:L-fuculose kinase n=1 Tax=Pseudoduganella flava TaxID=871742 RepID=A0A562Q3Z2_9BURK|nr:FGGY family carbohydrate kinase [Pseudoduganella flava]QGZ41490.1 L-fuculose kinase [Pseudoduganella flava]TWI51452.1 sugar (pentulose or hexulose) kinase [Pseudoduganella flava]